MEGPADAFLLCLWFVEARCWRCRFAGDAEGVNSPIREQSGGLGGDITSMGTDDWPNGGVGTAEDGLSEGMSGGVDLSVDLANDDWGARERTTARDNDGDSLHSSNTVFRRLLMSAVWSADRSSASSGTGKAGSASEDKFPLPSAEWSSS